MKGLVVVLAAPALAVSIALATPQPRGHVWARDNQTRSIAIERVFRASLGRGLGQTFVADDTLIRSVVLWRIAGEDTNYVGMRLFVYETDSSSVYPSGVVPNPNRRVLNGKTVVVPFGDGVHP